MLTNITYSFVNYHKNSGCIHHGMDHISFKSLNIYLGTTYLVFCWKLFYESILVPWKNLKREKGLKKVKFWKTVHKKTKTKVWTYKSISIGGAKKLNCYF